MARSYRYGAFSTCLSVLMWCSCSGQIIATEENSANQTVSSSNLVTAVGQSNGRLAIQFKGQYFAVFHDGENWAVENNVAADDLYIAPLDETKTEAICDPTRQSKADILQNCDGITGDQITQRRIFPTETNGFFHVEGAKYRVEAKQVIRDEKRVMRGSGARQIISTKDLFFEVSVIDPLDLNEWKIRLTPKRTQNGKLGMSDEDLNALAVAEEETKPLLGTLTTLGGDAEERNAIEYLPEVELEGVYKDVNPQNRRDLVSKTNPVLDSAFSQAAGEETDHSYPGVVSGGMRLSNYVQGVSTTVHDFQRLYQIFMRSKTQTGGFSRGLNGCGPGKLVTESSGSLKDASGQMSDGTGDRLQLLTQPGFMRFHSTLFECRQYWPFFMGICGAEVKFNVGVGGSLTYGNQGCFNAAPVPVNVSGCMEFRAEAGAGVGCDVAVAAMSAGVTGSLSTGACFNTGLNLTTGALEAGASFYSQVSLQAYMSARLLWWAQSWTSGPILSYRFGGAVTKQVPALSSLSEANASCDAARRGGTTTYGTCDIPGSVCDVNRRCVKMSENCIEPYQGSVRPGQRCVQSAWNYTDVGPCRDNLVDTQPQDNVAGSWCLQLNDRFLGCGGSSEEAVVQSWCQQTGSSAYGPCRHQDGNYYKFGLYPQNGQGGDFGLFQLATDDRGHALPGAQWQAVGQTDNVRYRMIYVPREARNHIHELAMRLPTSDEFGWAMGGFFALSTSGGAIAGLAASGAVGYVITGPMAEALSLEFGALNAIPQGATQFILTAARSSTLGLSLLASSMMGSTGQNAMNHINNVTSILTRVIVNPSSQRLTGTVIPKTFEFLGQGNRLIRVTDIATREMGVNLDKLVAQVSPQAVETTSKVILYDFWKNLSSAQIQAGINQIGSWVIEATIAGSVITIGTIQSGDTSEEPDPSKQYRCTHPEIKRRQLAKKDACKYVNDQFIKDKYGNLSPAYFKSFCMWGTPLKIYWGNWFTFGTPQDRYTADNNRRNVIEHCSVAEDWRIRYKNCHDAQWDVLDCYPDDDSKIRRDHIDDADRILDFIEDCEDLLDGRIQQKNLSNLPPFDCNNTNWSH